MNKRSSFGLAPNNYFVFVSICLQAMTLTRLNNHLTIWHYSRTALGNVTQRLSRPRQG